jgi:hypothetical protein
MAKNTAPLFGFGASGQVGKAIVFSNWKGRPYTRRHVVPANPQSTDQTVTRSLFSWLQQVWKLLDSYGTDPWSLYVKGLVQTNRNAFTSANIKAMRGDVDLANMVFSAGAKGGLPPTNITLSSALAGQLGVSLDAPSLPTGWSIVRALAVALKVQDPQTETFYNSVSDDVAAPGPYNITFSGLPSGETWQAGGFFEFTKADGGDAYGVSLSDSQLIS